MRFIGREARPWLGGAAAVVAGAAMLLVALYVPALKYTAVEYVNTVLAYPEKPALYIRNIVKLSGNWVLERATLNERVERLELDRQALAAALQRAGVQPAPQRGSYVRAVVTLRYPQDWRQEFSNDKGTKDGITEKEAVVSKEYFVGRVARAGDNYAWVEMLTSQSFMLASVVDQTRDLGVVNGDGVGRLNLLYIADERMIERGMTVSTSLMNDLIPPGLPIGTIIGVDRDNEGYMEIRISAGAHLTQLYNVEVFAAKKVPAK